MASISGNQGAGASRRRDKILLTVQDRFHEYGEELHSVITDAALDHFRMTRLFEALGLETRADLAGQLDTLFFFVATAGEATLLKKARDAEWQRAQAELARKSAKQNPPPGPSSASKPPAIEAKRSSAPSASASPRPLAPAVTAATPASSSAPLAQATEVNEIMLEAVPPPGSIADPAPSKAPAEPPQPDRPMIRVPGYTGPDRRGGVLDRRTHAERRDALTAIRQNRRFHGDRRKQPMGRRSGDAERNKSLYARKNQLAGVVILKKGQ